MDQLDRAVIAVLERLCGLAPATIENGVGGRHARCGGCVLAAHDSDQDIDRGLVWLRAIERISVMVFVISVFMRVWRDVFARRCVGMIDSGIIVANREAKRDGRKIGLPAVVLRARDEADDVGAHENPSHTAIAIYGVDSPVPKRHFRTNGLIGSLSESSPSSPAASGLSGSRLPIAQPAADQLSCRETAITGR